MRIKSSELSSNLSTEGANVLNDPVLCALYVFSITPESGWFPGEKLLAGPPPPPGPLHHQGVQLPPLPQPGHQQTEISSHSNNLSHIWQSQGDKLCSVVYSGLTWYPIYHIFNNKWSKSGKPRQLYIMSAICREGRFKSWPATICTSPSYCICKTDSEDGIGTFFIGWQ